MAQARGINRLTPTDNSLSATKRRALLKVNQHISKTFLTCSVKSDVWDNIQLVAVKQLKGIIIMIIITTIMNLQAGY